MIYITLFKCIDVKVINYTYFLIKKNRITFSFMIKRMALVPLMKFLSKYYFSFIYK